MRLNLYECARESILLYKDSIVCASNSDKKIETLREHYSTGDNVLNCIFKHICIFQD